MNSKNIFSYHTHSTFCDGKASMEDVCLKALELNMSALAFTSHAPVPFDNDFSLNFEQLMDYRCEFDRLNALYGKQINLLIGVEADYIPGETVSFNEWRRILNLDFVVGSVHLVKNSQNNQKWFIDGAAENYVSGLKDIYQNDIQIAVGDYYNQVCEMIATQKPDIVGHIDKVKMNNLDRFFQTTDLWYVDLLEKTLNVAKEFNSILEINSRGIYRSKYHECFPHTTCIQRCLDLGIPLTLASDTHHPDEFEQGFNLSLDIAVNAGVKMVSVFENGKWTQKMIEAFIA